ncbi:MAG TPA: alpha/beta hydrolase [Mycobacteriales bacterium]|nr:alpha/beta hydrolase [Mycobacteriales bacterium]
MTLPGEAVTLVTVDGVRLSAWHVPRSDAAGAPDMSLCVVLLHGFTGSLRRPAVQAVARGLAAHAAVLLVDQRGHGESAGVSTLGDLEVLDVDAGIAAARRLGYGRVVTQGWSMGGSSVLRHGALAAGAEGGRARGWPVREAPDAVVSVSAASRWGIRDTKPMRRLHWVVESPLGRGVGRFLGARIDPVGWPERSPLSPAEAARALTVPLLVVHGDRDGYFTLEHPRALAAAAGDRAQLWEVEGFGHAENAADAALVDRIGAHLGELVDAA